MLSKMPNRAKSDGPINAAIAEAITVSRLILLIGLA